MKTMYLILILVLSGIFNANEATAIPGGIVTKDFPNIKNLWLFENDPSQKLIHSNSEADALTTAYGNCTATLLNSKTILTAGHCFLPTLQPALFDEVQKKWILIHLKRTFALNENSDPEYHLSFSFETIKRLEIDIAVAELQSEYKGPLEAVYLANERDAFPEYNDEFQFLGCGYGKIRWDYSDAEHFGVMGEDSVGVKRVSRLHVSELDRKEIDGTENLLFSTKSQYFYKKQSENGAGIIKEMSSNGHDLLSVEGDSGGPILFEGVIFGVMNSHTVSVPEIPLGSYTKVTFKNWIQALQSPVVKSFLKKVEALGVSLPWSDGSVRRMRPVEDPYGYGDDENERKY